MAICYLNGEFHEQQNAHLPLDNLGVHRGLGVFDLFRARNGVPSFLEDYLDRFDNSQAFLNLGSKISKEEIRHAIQELQERNGFKNSVFKMVCLAKGDETSPIFEPFFFILNKQIPDDLKPSPSTLITTEYLRENPGIKSLNYMTSFRLQERRIQAGAIDILFHKDGEVTETSRSNIFIVKDGVLKTPRNVLPGITRKKVIQLVDQEFKVRQESVSLNDLWSADEVFITSTIKEIMPIIEIDGKPVGNGKAGPVVSKITETWYEFCS